MMYVEVWNFYYTRKCKVSKPTIFENFILNCFKVRVACVHTPFNVIRYAFCHSAAVDAIYNIFIYICIKIDVVGKQNALF
jgi:hypothetical protein